jgi:anti-sigma regulatory factor (Ser/Thr protein kinase)
MAQASWPRRPPPGRGAAGRTLGRWWPVRPADLTAGRLQLSAALHDGSRPAGAREGAVERLVMAFEELASNAVRHGRAPVEVAVSDIGDRAWLLTVSDAAGSVPPTPAVGRDAARGGLGLHMVAGAADAHGWTPTSDGRKTVWALIELDRAESRP